MEIAYMWEDTQPGKRRLGEAPWWCVAVPVPDAPVWILWVRRQDARKRKLDHSRGVWLFHPSLKAEIEARFIQIGWMVRYEMPYFYPDNDPAPPPPPNSVPWPRSADPYRTLHILPTAPKAVVDGAYKALMRQVHSDYGGDDGDAQVLNVARDKIYQERGW